MTVMNLAKYIAHCGICSRRDAENFILSGEVRVGSQYILDPAHDVEPKEQKIFLKNKCINLIEDIKLFAFYKPKGCIVSKEDPKGRTTIYDLIKKNYNNILLQRLIYVGRLDYNSEGLILLTNYGPFARYFELPENQIKRVYEVKIFGEWRDTFTKILKTGIIVDKVKYLPIHTKILSKKDKQIWIECHLHEGKNNELRKIFKHLGFLVSHLKRVRYSEFSVAGLEKGQLIEINKKIVDKIVSKNNIKEIESLPIKEKKLEKSS